MTVQLGNQRFKRVAVKLGLINRKYIFPVQVYIISYPKSGRTWLRVLLGKTLCEHFDISEKYLLNPYKLTIIAQIYRLAKVTRTEFTHDGSDLIPPRNFNELQLNKSRYSKNKIVFLIRDPKDVCVSSYFHLTKRSKIFKGSLSEFIRDEKYGIKKILKFHKIWFENQTLPRDFLMIRYEDMSNNPALCIRSVLNFLECKDVPEQVVEKAVSFSRFENMKQLEQKEKFKSEILKPGNPSDEGSYKVRQGKVGSYVDYMSEEDIEFIEQAILEIGNPFYS